MSNIENDEKYIDELFNFDFADELLEIDFSSKLKPAKRSGVRYVRDDISAAVCKAGPLSFGRELFIEFVELLDISSTGALVACEKDILRENETILMNLNLTQGELLK